MRPTTKVIMKRMTMRLVRSTSQVLRTGHITAAAAAVVASM